MQSSNPRKKRKDLLFGLSLVLATGSIAVAQMTPGTRLAPGSATATPTSSPGATPTVSPTTTPTGRLDLIATAEAAGQFKTLLQELQAAGLTDTLKGPGPYTIFAPTDEAFAKLPPDVQSRLQSDPALLQQVLLYHVVAGQSGSNLLRNESGVVSEEGEIVTVSVSGNETKVDNARITKADVEGSNGVIHEIDTVLIPPSLVALLGMPGVSPSPTTSPTGAPSGGPSPVYTIFYNSR